MDQIMVTTHPGNPGANKLVLWPFGYTQGGGGGSGTTINDSGRWWIFF